MKYLDQVIEGRNNNFNLMRLFAALSVLVYHSVLETRGYNYFDGWKGHGTTPGGLAVDVFFITSGLLVTRSLDHSRNALTFATARIMRIFPGLIVCLLFTGLVIGPIYSPLSLVDYLQDISLLVHYVVASAQPFFVSPSSNLLPGTSINNGPLWSIPVEICCYTLLLCSWLGLGVARKQLRSWVYIPTLLAIAWASWRFHQTAGFRLAWMFWLGCGHVLDSTPASHRWAGRPGLFLCLHRLDLQSTDLQVLSACLSALHRRLSGLSPRGKHSKIQCIWRLFIRDLYLQLAIAIRGAERSAGGRSGPDDCSGFAPGIVGRHAFLASRRKTRVGNEAFGRGASSHPGRNQAPDSNDLSGKK